MQTDFDYLLSLVDGNVSLIENDKKINYDEYNNIYKIEKIKLPLLGTVACGEPIYADEDRKLYNIWY